MNNDDEETSGAPTFLRQRRSKKNRQTKTQLIFDENARRDYLKGFHKRKLERRERAQKDLEDEIKSDLKNLRQKRRDDMKRKHEAMGLLDTVESQPKKRTVELKNHTIEIAEIDDEMISKTGLFLGAKQVGDDANEAQPDGDEDETNEKKTKSKRPLSKKMSILQSLKTPKTTPPKGKVRRSRVKYGKNGGIQTASKKKRTRH